MANAIELFKQYIPMLDEVYKMASLTSKLDGNPELVQQGANANELIIPMIEMDGLADYERNGGYVSGNVTLTNQTKKCNFDRGRKFTVDALDNIESAMLAFGRLASEFIRTKVVPELDAFRLSTYASTAGVSNGNGTITTGKQAVEALRAGLKKMDNDEVPYEDRHLYATPTIIGLIKDMDTTASKEVMEEFASVTKIPSSRLVTKIKQLNGKTTGEEKGGYKKADDAQDIDFEIIHRPALVQFGKRNVNKIFTPEQNQDSDGWIMVYRDVNIAEVYKNKLAGIYVHTPTAITPAADPAE